MGAADAAPQEEAAAGPSQEESAAAGDSTDSTGLNVDPTLTPEILAAQLERLLCLQGQIQASLAGPGSSQGQALLSNLDTEVASLVDLLCRQHLSTIGESRMGTACF